MTTTTPTLTTPHFQTAMQKFLDETKPDLLARNQIEKLHVEWDQHARARAQQAHGHDAQHHRGSCGGAESVESARLPQAALHDEQPNNDCLDWREQWQQQQQQQQHQQHVVELNGTLQLSSEYIKLCIHVSCRFVANTTTATTNTTIATTPNAGGDNNNPSNNGNFCALREELHLRLRVHASFLSLTEFKNLKKHSIHEYGTTDKKAHRGDSSRKERAIGLKLRKGMMQRLSSDPYVRSLLAGDLEKDGCIENGNENRNGNESWKGRRVEAEGQPLCEVLIQQNRNINTTTGNNDENRPSSSSIQQLEERVDVHEPTLEGMRRAIFSQWDDNLDVLEFLLHMPFFPRKVYGGSCGSGSGSNGVMLWFCDENGDANNAMDASSFYSKQGSLMDSLAQLGERAYLRLLEDAMFDACEKEGEEEILEDLTISGRTREDVGHDDGGGDDDGDGSRTDGCYDRRGRNEIDSRLSGKSDRNRYQKIRGKPLPGTKRAKPF